MSKLKLDLDALNVDTFDTTPAYEGGGTVLANQGTYISCQSPCITPTPHVTCISCVGLTCMIHTCHHITCGPTCQITCQRTCAPTCHVTCAHTCAPTCHITCQHSCLPTCITCPTGCMITCDPVCGFSRFPTCGIIC